jgi:hypothetical protein
LRKGPLSLLLGVGVGLGMVSCGKKGPPLAPFSDLPAAVTDLSARQVGGELIFQFTVPAANADGRKPANLERVELYVHTARPRVPSDYVRQGRLAGSVKVRQPPPPDEEKTSPVPAESDVEQGGRASITAMPDFFVPPVLRRPAGAAAASPAPLFPDGGGPLLSPRPPASETRVFVVVGVNRRGRAGAPSSVLELPILTPPPAPTDLQVSYTEQAIVLAWTPPSFAIRRPIQDPTPRAGALGSRPLVTSGSPRAYNVYEVMRPDAPDPNPLRGAVQTPLNMSPLTETRFEDLRTEFGVERCFHVRTRETVGTFVVESAGSRMTCVTPIDTFPPAPPSKLIGVRSEDAVSLLWDANAETDLAGYQVLRGEGADEKLQPLTKAPISETTYRDTTVQGGRMYVYAVLAIDKAGNISAQSNRFVSN